MGLRNAAQSFQKLMNFVLDGMVNTFCYLDDILIFSKDEDDHKKTLHELFKRLENNGLTINIKKCHFAQEELTFLGYKVRASNL